jgi:hypothetical protein
MNLPDELLNIAIEIAAYEEERAELTKTLQALDAEMIKGKDQDTLLYLQESIDRYKEVIKKLRILLECYFDEERIHNIPTDINYRKYYKLICNAL